MATLSIGMDIGQRRDPTAIAVAEQGEGRAPIFTVRYLTRLELGTPYPAVAARAAAIVRGAVRAYRQPAEREDGHALAGAGWEVPVSVHLVVDVTGVGRPVFDLLLAELESAGAREVLDYTLQPTAATFTHGDRLTSTADGLSVGKAYLVSRLQALLQTSRIRLPRTEEAAALAEELLAYEIRISEDANDRYGAFKVGAHDDLVTALGLAVLREHEEGRVLYLCRCDSRLRRSGTLHERGGESCSHSTPR